MKLLTKEEFRDAFCPTVDGKIVLPPKIDLLPNNKCRINGNIYSININIDNMIELEKL